MASQLWVTSMITSLRVHSSDSWAAFLAKRKATTDSQTKHAAFTAGWEARQSWNWSYDIFYPGAARRSDLCLPVYDGDKLQLGRWDEAYDRHGIRFGGYENALAFIRERIQAAFGPDGKPIQRVPAASPAEYSSSIVMVQDDDGLWWPARLATSNEVEQLRHQGHLTTRLGIIVVLLCYNRDTGAHQWHMTEAECCYRITPQELEELYYLSKGEAIEAHVPDAHLLVRKKLHKWQGSNLFRSAIAYALALDRIVPEDQRRVTNNARPRNTTTVPAFTDAQLSDPLTPEVKSALAFALPSLESYLDMMRRCTRGRARGGSGGALTLSNATASSRATTTTPMHPHPLQGSDDDVTTDEEEAMDGPKDKRRARRRRNSKKDNAAAAVAAAASSAAASSSNPALSSSAAASASTATATAGAASCAGLVAQLLAAFERAMEAAGMQGDAKAKTLLERLRDAGTVFAKDGPSHATEAFTAFVVLWGRVCEQLEQQRAALPHATATPRAVHEQVFTRLAGKGLGEYATQVVDAKSAQPLHDRLDALLAQEGWTRETLQAKGQELEQEKDQTTTNLASLSNICTTTPKLAPDIEPAKAKAAACVTQLKVTLQRHKEAVSIQQTIKEVEGLLQSLPRVETLAIKHESTILALWGAVVERVASST